MGHAINKVKILISLIKLLIILVIGYVLVLIIDPKGRDPETTCD